MTELTMQHYFEVTVRYLRNQNRQAKNSNLCKYLAEDGNVCAVGLWIPAGHEAQGLSGRVDRLAANYPSLRGVAWPDLPDGLALAVELQELHDLDGYRIDAEGSEGCGGLNERGEEKIRRIAREYGLTYPDLEPPEPPKPEISGEELMARIERHALHMAGAEGGEVLSLEGVDLPTSAKWEFCNRDLRYAAIRDCDLTDVDFGGSDLTGADLRGSDLTGAEFRNANLEVAQLPSGFDWVQMGSYGPRSRMIRAYRPAPGAEIVVMAGCIKDSADRVKARLAERRRYYWPDDVRTMIRQGRLPEGTDVDHWAAAELEHACRLIDLAVERLAVKSDA